MLRPTQVPARRCAILARTGLSPAPARLSRRFRFPDASARRRPYNPGTRVATPPVWAPPRSLAATGGIVFTFYSCGYLDVSVPRVRLHAPHGCRDRSRRVAPFGNPRIRGYLLHPAAYRSLSRPSSPPRAKASPMRPSSIPFYLHGRQARLVSYLFSPCLLYRSAYPRLPKEPRFSLTALVVFYFMSLCLLARGQLDRLAPPSLSTASSLVIVLFPLRPVALTPPQPFIRWRITESNR